MKDFLYNFLVIGIFSNVLVAIMLPKINDFISKLKSENKNKNIKFYKKEKTQSTIGLATSILYLCYIIFEVVTYRQATNNEMITKLFTVAFFSFFNFTIYNFDKIYIKNNIKLFFVLCTLYSLLFIGIGIVFAAVIFKIESTYYQIINNILSLGIMAFLINSIRIFNLGIKQNSKIIKELQIAAAQEVTEKEEAK